MNLFSFFENLWFNRVSWIQTFFFNFHYLPFSQAIKLPIYLHKPIFYREWGGRSFFFRLSGKVTIECKDIQRGMIRMGFIRGTSHIDNGFIWGNTGEVVFKGKCDIAQGSSIRNGGGKLQLGDGFRANPNTKFICYYHIEIGDNTLNSWDVTYCDYDFHAMKNVYTDKKLKPFAPIIIGNNNWIGQNCIILKNTNTPNYTTISAGSVVSRKFKCSEKSIIAGNPAEIVAEGAYYMDYSDCVYTGSK